MSLYLPYRHMDIFGLAFQFWSTKMKFEIVRNSRHVYDTIWWDPRLDGCKRLYFDLVKPNLTPYYKAYPLFIPFVTSVAHLQDCLDLWFYSESQCAIYINAMYSYNFIYRISWILQTKCMYRTFITFTLVLYKTWTIKFINNIISRCDE